MTCPKCSKQMTLTERGWTHVYDLSQYMKEGEELCTYIVKEADSASTKEADE